MEPLDPYLASLADLSGLRFLQDQAADPVDFNFENTVTENTSPIQITNTTSSIKNTTSYKVIKQPQYEGSV